MVVISKMQPAVGMIPWCQAEYCSLVSLVSLLWQVYKEQRWGQTFLQGVRVSLSLPVLKSSLQVYIWMLLSKISQPFLAVLYFSVRTVYIRHPNTWLLGCTSNKVAFLTSQHYTDGRRCEITTTTPHGQWVSFPGIYPHAGNNPATSLSCLKSITFNTNVLDC